MDRICDDLAAEHAALDDIVADLTEEQWLADTPAEGWDVKDTIVHLIQADVAARIAGGRGTGPVRRRPSGTVPWRRRAWRAAFGEQG